MDCLPPGFRFFPSDEELVTFYLARKAMDASFTSAAIGDVDLYKSEPWDLPCKAAMTTGGEDEECYFFCMKGSRYPSGARARRATAAGYWKSTGKDKGVHCSRGGRLVGMKKTLVFYRGRAPRGEKTSWVMHEYTLMGQASSGTASTANSTRGAHSEWVICRLFMKKPSSELGALEMEQELEETAHGHSSPGHALPKALSDGCDDKEGAAPPMLSDDPWHTGGRSVDDRHGKDHMVHQENLSSTSTMDRSRCASPSWLLLNNDDQLGPYCSTLHILQHYSSAPDSLPELLEYNGHDLHPGGVADHRAEIWSAPLDSLHFDGLPCWNNFGF